MNFNNIELTAGFKKLLKDAKVKGSTEERLLGYFKDYLKAMVPAFDLYATDLANYINDYFINPKAPISIKVDWERTNFIKLDYKLYKRMRRHNAYFPITIKLICRVEFADSKINDPKKLQSILDNTIIPQIINNAPATNAYFNYIHNNTEFQYHADGLSNRKSAEAISTDAFSIIYETSPIKLIAEN